MLKTLRCMQHQSKFWAGLLSYVFQDPGSHSLFNLSTTIILSLENRIIASSGEQQFLRDPADYAHWVVVRRKKIK